MGVLCRGMPEGARHVLAGSVSMVAYPMQQLAAFRQTERRQSYGLRIKVGPPAMPFSLAPANETDSPVLFLRYLRAG